MKVIIQVLLLDDLGIPGWTFEGHVGLFAVLERGVLGAGPFLQLRLFCMCSLSTNRIWNLGELKKGGKVL